jgi:hypothetical protein
VISKERSEFPFPTILLIADFFADFSSQGVVRPFMRRRLSRKYPFWVAMLKQLLSKELVVRSKAEVGACEPAYTWYHDLNTGYALP